MKKAKSNVQSLKQSRYKSVCLNSNLPTIHCYTWAISTDTYCHVLFKVTDILFQFIDVFSYVIQIMCLQQCIRSANSNQGAPCTVHLVPIHTPIMVSI